MENANQKIVRFYLWCPKCVHYEKPPSADPCHGCLGTPVNTNSRKPINFKENGGKKK